MIPGAGDQQWVETDLRWLYPAARTTGIYPLERTEHFTLISAGLTGGQWGPSRRDDISMSSSLSNGIFSSVLVGFYSPVEVFVLGSAVLTEGRFAAIQVTAGHSEEFKLLTAQLTTGLFFSQLVTYNRGRVEAFTLASVSLVGGSFG
jgi:hypothetical protein